MEQTSFDFFQRLVDSPSPSGYEQPVQKVVREWCTRFADDVKTDTHGNVIAIRNPKGSPRILLDGHCDQIGLVIQHIDADGFLYVQPIGGWDTQILLGQRVTVWAVGGPITGVIARKPKHLLTEAERKAVPEVHELWVDLGVRSKEEAARLVSIGDPVTLALGLHRLQNDLVAGTKMDNTTGLFVVMETLRRLHGESFDPAVFFVSSVQEEIGFRGAQTAAFGIEPDVGIAVDVTHATDCPTIDKRANGDIRVGGGPILMRGPNINPIVFDRLKQAARESESAVQIKAAPRATSNNANILQITKAGVAAAVVAIPNRYMHSPVEVVSLDDLDRAATILAQFIRSTKSDTNFVPQ